MMTIVPSVSVHNLMPSTLWAAASRSTAGALNSMGCVARMVGAVEEV
jgi:hypothetical protein